MHNLESPSTKLKSIEQRVTADYWSIYLTARFDTRITLNASDLQNLKELENGARRVAEYELELMKPKKFVGLWAPQKQDQLFGSSTPKKSLDDFRKDFNEQEIKNHSVLQSKYFRS
jgi:hypothetical protein